MSAPVEAPTPPAVLSIPALGLPWYAFLYRLFGAQGTFWLWIVSIVAIWWTASPTFERFANRQRTRGRSPASLGGIGLSDPTRWVETKGVLVHLDRALLNDERPAALSPMPVLFDPTDPAAAWWRQTRELAWQLPRPAVVPFVGGIGGVMDSRLDPKRVQVRRALQVRMNELREEPSRFVPAPSSCLLIQPREGCPNMGQPARPYTEGGPGGIQGVLRSINEWAALVRTRVQPDATVTGVLASTPETVSARLKAELGAEVAPWVLQADVEPRDTETYVFAGAAITLLLLAGGFHGVLRAAGSA